MSRMTAETADGIKMTLESLADAAFNHFLPLYERNSWLREFEVLETYRREAYDSATVPWHSTPTGRRQAELRELLWGTGE